jgi:hypothetical protein
VRFIGDLASDLNLVGGIDNYRATFVPVPAAVWLFGGVVRADGGRQRKGLMERGARKLAVTVVEMSANIKFGIDRMLEFAGLGLARKRHV